MLKDIRKSLEHLESSFKSDAKNVKICSENLERALLDIKNKTLTEELPKFDQIEMTLRLIEKLSILNEYKLNLFKDFSTYNFQKK